MDLPILTRPEKFEVLRQAVELLPDDVRARRGFTNGVFRLLEQLEVHTGRGTCSWTVELIASWCRWSKRTALRYIAAAEELGWLVVERRPPCNNVYRIDWGQVQQDAERSEPECHSDLKSPRSAMKSPRSDLKSPRSAMKSPRSDLKSPCPIGTHARAPNSLPKKVPSVCSDVKEEEHTLLRSRLEEIQQAVADVSQRDLQVSHDIIAPIAEQLAESGHTANEVRKLKPPRFWTEPPTPRQVLELAVAAKRKAEAAGMAKRDRTSTILAVRQQAQASEREQLQDKEARQLWARLPPEERSRRIDEAIHSSKSPHLFPRAMFEDLAMKKWREECLLQTCHE